MVSVIEPGVSAKKMIEGVQISSTAENSQALGKQTASCYTIIPSHADCFMLFMNIKYFSVPKIKRNVNVVVRFDKKII